MKNLLKSNFVFILIIVLSGCRKDSQITPVCEVDSTATLCDDFPPPPVLGWHYDISGNQYHSPCFNPNNSNEFVYLKDDDASTYTQLIKYDLISGAQTVLCDSKIILSQPQWGSEGWIIFDAFEGISVIYKIFEDGTGLEQITDYNSFDPGFTSSGEAFIAMGGHPDISGEYRPIMNLDGNLVDSIRYRFDNIVIGYPYLTIDETFHDSYQLYSDHEEVGRRGIGLLKENSVFSELNSFFNKYPIISISKNSDHLFYTSRWGNLFKLNLNTLETSVFKEGCQTRYYHFMDVSPDGSKILVEKVFSSIREEVIVDEEHEIWIMNIDGSEEKKILGD